MEFKEYLLLSSEEKDVYREVVYDAEERAVIYEYERFKNAIELMTIKPEVLRCKYNQMLSVAEEVALTFDNECVYVAHHLKSEKCISEEMYNLVMQIDIELKMLSSEHDERNWTIQAMTNDRRWVKARRLENEVYGLLV